MPRRTKAEIQAAEVAKTVSRREYVRQVELLQFEMRKCLTTVKRDMLLGKEVDHSCVEELQEKAEGILSVVQKYKKSKST